jgi:hypothetical protein
MVKEVSLSIPLPNLTMRKHIAIAAMLLALPLAAQKRAAVGETMSEFSFGKLLENDGRTGLADCYGYPVMIDFWGVH